MLHEIPREQWAAFLGDFGNRHAGWLVTLELHQPGRGKLIEADGQPLHDLLSDRAEQHRTISVVLGDVSEPRLTHIVDDPTRLRLSKKQPGEAEDLEIDGQDGSTTVLHLHAPARQAA